MTSPTGHPPPGASAELEEPDVLDGPPSPLSQPPLSAKELRKVKYTKEKEKEASIKQVPSVGHCERVDGIRDEYCPPPPPPELG